MDILALNCGSSSVKYQLFDWNKKEVIAKGMVERVIVGDSFIIHEVPGRETYREEHRVHRARAVRRAAVDADGGPALAPTVERVLAHPA